MLSGPKNLGEGYRLNTAVLYYTFDPSFAYFGSTGEAAVQQAFDMMNSLTNVDSYSPNLTEFPLNSQSVNYSAATWGLMDLKSRRWLCCWNRWFGRFSPLHLGTD